MEASGEPTVTIPASLLETLLRGNVTMTQLIASRTLAHAPALARAPPPPPASDRSDTDDAFVNAVEAESSTQFAAFFANAALVLTFVFFLMVVGGPVLRMLTHGLALPPRSHAGICPILGGMRPPPPPPPHQFLFRTSGTPTA